MGKDRICRNIVWGCVKVKLSLFCLFFIGLSASCHLCDDNRIASTSFKSCVESDKSREMIREIRNCAIKAWMQQEKEFAVYSSKAGYPVEIRLDRAIPGFSNENDRLYEVKIYAVNVLFGVVWLNPENGKCFHLIGPEDYANLYKEPVVEFKEKRYNEPMPEEARSALKAKFNEHLKKADTKCDFYQYKLAFSIPNFSISGKMFTEYIIRNHDEKIIGIYWFSEDGNILEVLPFLDAPEEKEPALDFIPPTQ